MDPLQLANEVMSRCYPGLMGVKVTEISKEKGVIETEITSKHLNPAGVMHGGAIVTLADTIATIMTIYVYGDTVTTTNLTVNYLKAVNTGKVTAVAVPLRKGKKLAVWDVKCYDIDGNMIAYVTATLMPLKPIWETNPFLEEAVS